MLATASSAVIARKTAKSGQIGVGHGGHKATQCYATGTVLQYNKGQFGANWDCMRGWMYLLHKGGGAFIDVKKRAKLRCISSRVYC